MSILIVCAPDEGASAFGRELSSTAQWRCAPMEQVDAAALLEASAVVLVLPDYYTHACWQMKRWLSAYGAALTGKLCACIVLCEQGGGGELALRTIISQLLPCECVVYLCGVLCGDGTIHLGGCAGATGEGLSAQTFCTKLAEMSSMFA